MTDVVTSSDAAISRGSQVLDLSSSGEFLVNVCKFLKRDFFRRAKPPVLNRGFIHVKLFFELMTCRMPIIRPVGCRLQILHYVWRFIESVELQ